MISWTLLCLFNLFYFVSFSQWVELQTVSTPLNLQGHSVSTWNDLSVVFGGRSQTFKTCTNVTWDLNDCGDKFSYNWTDTSYALANPLNGQNCTDNCNTNGWCVYSESEAKSFCICYDDFRGELCQYREIQQFELELYVLNTTTAQWQNHSLKFFCFGCVDLCLFFFLHLYTFGFLLFVFVVDSSIETITNSLIFGRGLLGDMITVLWFIMTNYTFLVDFH